ncbi:MAG: AI-2E family transporter, partial [Treponema sp.]|nr:AI-2E family transporter [Treponema sp.]
MTDRFRHFNSGRVNFFLLAVITVILFGGVLKITASVVVPFTVSLLLAVVTNLIVNFLEKFHIPRIAGVFLVLIIFLGALFFMGMILYKSGQSLLSVYPKYEARLTDIYVYIAHLFDLPYDQHLSFFDNLWGQIGVRSRVRVMTLSFSNAFLVFLKDALMVALFMVFLLLESVFLREKL